MTRRSVFLLPVALWGEQQDGLQYTLTKYVRPDGKVQYQALKNDLAPLEKYVDKLKSFDAGKLPSREAKLAHWINVYNALILWSFAKDYPQEKDRLKNPLRRAAYFYRRKFLVGGAERSLADIEDNSIRKAFNEPRIHFAIVCASASCPWLSQKAYTAANVMGQLELEASQFIGAERNVKIDAAAKTVTVSEIFKWFRADFGGSEAAVLKFLGRYIKSARLDEPGWKLIYRKYDWSINDAV
jgi:hypothetical protein